MNNKKGDIVYESMAKACHVVGKIKVPKNAKSIKALKFEERYKGRRNIPISHLNELGNLGNYKPFSFSNGSSKYSIYKFSKNGLSKLQNRTVISLEPFLDEVRLHGLTKTFSRFNKGNNQLVRKLKKLEFEHPKLLDYLWQKSFKKFMGN